MNYFNQMRLGKRLITGFVMVAVMSVIIADDGTDVLD